MELAYNGNVYPLPAALLYLRTDGTFVFGYCDNQVSEIGRFRQNSADGSITLYDRYDLYDRKSLRDQVAHPGSSDSLLYVVTHAKKPGFRRNVVLPLKRNSRRVHSGFLRGQEMDADSLATYYRLRSADEQLAWSDSVNKAAAGH